MLRELTETQRRRQCGARLKELQRVTHVRRTKRGEDPADEECKRREVGTAFIAAINF